MPRRVARTTAVTSPPKMTTRSPSVNAATKAFPLVSAAESRALLLEGCCLARTPTKASRAAVLRIIRELGFVQLDSISSVERAHHLIMHARLDGYAQAMLAHHTETTRHAFEHWTHDASVIRRDWLVWWTHRFERSRVRLATHAWMRSRLGANWQATIAHVHDQIKERGALATRDFTPPKGVKPKKDPGEGWWNWSPHKAALEFLWRSGDLAVHSRRGFEKVYDLSERVHGPRDTMPSRGDTVEWACTEALARLGAATARELCHFMDAITLAEANHWCAWAVKEERVARVYLQRGARSDIVGVARLEWKRAAQKIELHSEPRLLSPFDPLVRDRARLSALFGFDYRFEAFVPAAKRVHGYYTMPVLVDGALVARVDLASDRAAGVLRVARVWCEPQFPQAQSKSHAATACARLAMQLQLKLEMATRSRGS
ncbi:MAG: winged helix-turn-helix domain-containing protein [Planctomycetota bacterium]|nr:MAG: winged helix-turn-helix domain-containing protein [Planctomycetota bacterium]